MTLRPLAEIERESIVAALDACGVSPGHHERKVEAARALGISLKTLYTKIHRYGLARQYLDRQPAPEETS